MTVEYIEEVARGKRLSGKEQQDYEEMLDQVADKEQVFRFWNNMYMVSIGFFTWFVMFSAIMFALSLEIEYQLLPGIGWFLVVALLIFFFAFLTTMFVSQKHGRELSAFEARVLAFLESR